MKLTRQVMMAAGTLALVLPLACATVTVYPTLLRAPKFNLAGKKVALVLQGVQGEREYQRKKACVEGGQTTFTLTSQGLSTEGQKGKDFLVFSEGSLNSEESAAYEQLISQVIERALRSGPAPVKLVPREEAELILEVSARVSQMTGFDTSRCDPAEAKRRGEGVRCIPESVCSKARQGKASTGEFDFVLTANAGSDVKLAFVLREAASGKALGQAELKARGFETASASIVRGEPDRPVPRYQVDVSGVAGLLLGKRAKNLPDASKPYNFAPLLGRARTELAGELAQALPPLFVPYKQQVALKLFKLGDLDQEGETILGLMESKRWAEAKARLKPLGERARSPQGAMEPELRAQILYDYAVCQAMTGELATALKTLKEAAGFKREEEISAFYGEVQRMMADKEKLGRARGDA